MNDPDRLGPRLESVTYDGEITGLCHLTGIELPLSKLVLVTAESDDFDIATARYISRFCFKYGVGKVMKPPALISESGLETVEKALEQDVPVEVRGRKHD